MDSAKVSNWLQIAGNFGLLAGLVLVAIQVNQNTQIARAQLLSVGWMNVMETQLAMMGERPAEAWAKAVTGSQPLTDEDVYVLDAMLNANWMVAGRVESVAEAGFEIERTERMAAWVTGFLGNDFSASWWEVNKDGWAESAPTTTAAVESFLATRPENRRLLVSRLAQLRDGMNPETQQ